MLSASQTAPRPDGEAVDVDAAARGRDGGHLARRVVTRRTAVIVGKPVRSTASVRTGTQSASAVATTSIPVPCDVHRAAGRAGLRIDLEERHAAPRDPDAAAEQREALGCGVACRRRSRGASRRSSRVDAEERVVAVGRRPRRSSRRRPCRPARRRPGCARPPCSPTVRCAATPAPWSSATQTAPAPIQML